MRKTLFGHPRGLIVLFFVEMWERFSYYGMWGILIFYLTWHFLLERQAALTLYGAFVALAYFAPLVGGYIADRVIGHRRAVIFGGVLLVIGHTLMGIHGHPAEERLLIEDRSYQLTREPYDEDESRALHVNGQTYRISRYDFVQPGDESSIRSVSYTDDSGERRILTGELVRTRSTLHTQVLYAALAFIAAGVGFLKPAISACVGALYDEGDRRQDAGYTLYYMGISIGAAAAAICVPILAALWGWAVAFGAAAIGMAIGLALFLFFQRELEGRAEAPEPTEPGDSASSFARRYRVYLSGPMLALAAYGLLQIAEVTSTAMHVAFAVTSAALLCYMFRTLERHARERMLALLVLCLVSILFWTLFDQAPSSLNLFAAVHVDTEISGLNVPAPVLLSANPLFLIAFSIPIAALWTRLAAAGRDPNVFAKFGLAMAQIGIGYFVLNLGIRTAGMGGENPATLSIGFILLMYLLHTTGELCLSPIGLSAVNKLSPPRLVGFMMGFWFFAASYANILASIVAKATQVTEGTPPAQSLAAYDTVYFHLGAAAMITAAVLLVASRRLGRLTHGAG